MIVGTGIDIVELDRIQASFDRFGERFLKRILTGEERKIMPERNPIPFLAARFAAKEAGSKALGTGFSRGVGPQTISVVSHSSGRPVMLFLGAARRIAGDMGVQAVHVSLSHGRDVAAAMVVLED